MSVLPNNTFASPGNPYYSPIGGVGANLQSPVIVIPEPGGAASLTVQSVAPGAATISALGANGEVGSVVVGSGGAVYRMATGVGGIPNLQIGAIGVGTHPAITYDFFAGDTILGDQSAGTVLTNQALIVHDYAAVGGDTNGVFIAPLSANTSQINQVVATTGTLRIGSSLAQEGTLQLSDAGANSGSVVVGGNGGVGIVLTGATAAPGSLPNIKPNIGNTGTLTIGCSGANPASIYIRDGATAGTGVVDITNGTASGALRLQGQDISNYCNLAPNFPGAGLKIGSSSLQPIQIQLTDTEMTVYPPIYNTLPPYANYSPTTLAATGSVYNGVFNISIAGLATGYWMILGKTSLNPSGADRTSMFSVIVYVLSGLIKAGGTAAYPTYWTTIPNATDDSKLTVTLSSATTTNYSIVAMPITYA